MVRITGLDLVCYSKNIIIKNICFVFIA